MPRYTDSRVIAYPRDVLFEVVYDVKHYPSFLPWCIGARIYAQTPGQFDADLIIGFKMLRESFTSRVTYAHGAWVEVAYRRGPMKHLYNRWDFEPTECGTHIKFEVDFAFKNPLLARMGDDSFTDATQKVLQAFIDRARDLHQQRSAARLSPTGLPITGEGRP